MVNKILLKRLTALKDQHDIFILKGFSLDLIKQLSDEFLWIDSYVANGNKICLEELNSQRLLMAIMTIDKETKAICTIESFIKLCNQIQGLSILGKRFCVIENNMLRLYPNPSDADLPDYDSSNLQSDNDVQPYTELYSFCETIDGSEYVEYIDNYSSENTEVLCKIPLIQLASTGNIKTAPDDGYPIISTKDNSVWNLLADLYYGRSLPTTTLGITYEDSQDQIFSILISACKVFKKHLDLVIVKELKNPEPRQDLYDIISKVWGYDNFRQLKIYKNLFINRDLCYISQGSIIETVIQQAEKALAGNKIDINNVLLTSPTGAGKSLLFQTSAIYLAETYQLLTIIVSPLVALMEDQVDGLENYDKVATLNSNKSAIEKQTILEKIQNGDINILYLSPELLLSYSISTFLGNRRLGLLVIDEAHTVTTWGRDFRVDYWFLGDYIRTAKKKLNYSFPIFALTATAVWDPIGKNDMVFDTISSLNMSPCIKYIGAVKRDNIVFDIKQSDITTKYEERRKDLTLSRIKESINEDKKTIVYFPFRSTADNVFFCKEADEIRNRMTLYHARLSKFQKSQNAEAFKTGEKIVMCATKAFGMGIDVPDIEVVYHHAPTGCLSDYVQEIGRLARDPKIMGTAKIDFNTKDFKYIRQLHGLSAIKPYQLFQVLKKLLELFNLNGEHRNMLISPEDFAYIFPLSRPEDMDKNIKSCLLLISHDLRNKLGFHALIVRPKSLFTQCYLELPRHLQSDFHRSYCQYLKRLDLCHFILDAEKFWNEHYSNISFPSFKHKLATGNVFGNYNAQLVTRFDLLLNQSVKETKKSISAFFQYANKFLSEMITTHHRMSFQQIIDKLPLNYSNEEKEFFLQTFRLLYASDKYYSSNGASFCRIYPPNDPQREYDSSFQVIDPGFERISSIYNCAIEKYISGEQITIYCKQGDIFIYLADFLNSLNLAVYNRQGGEKSEIFIRINNPFYLKNMIRKKVYENGILESIYDKYQFSERVFTYFFSKQMTNEERWQFIEDYFLGTPENELLK